MRQSSFPPWLLPPPAWGHVKKGDVMIPVGPERDRLICWTKLKEVPIDERRPYCTKCNPECDFYNLYSTDITAAMRLLPDLLWDGYQLTVQQNLTRTELSATFIQYTQIKYQAEGCDFINEVIADAISGAWLKWKETP